MDYLITSYLYSVYPKLKPGQLTDLRSLSVNNKAFAYVAVARSFQKFLICDSSSLSEAIKVYVDFINTPASERDLLGEPKCPKVTFGLLSFLFGCVSLLCIHLTTLLSLFSFYDLFVVILMYIYK